jgi:hypothetical protein
MRRLAILFAALVLAVSAAAPVAAVRQQAGGGTNFFALLTGANEVTAQGVRDQGDPDGFGIAFVNVNSEINRVCWIITQRGLDPVVAEHIHRAPATTTCTVVVDLMPPLANPTSFGCTNNVNPDVIGAILRDPAGHYVNVHTTVYPAGAIRGQLRTLPLFGMMPPTLTRLLR